MSPIFPQAVPNFSGFTTDPVIVDSNYFGNDLLYTELAESLKPLLNTTSVRELFPDETYEGETIKIEEEFSPVGTTLPIVQKGQPDVFIDQSGYKFSVRYASPIFIRGSFGLTHGEINSKVKPGTVNDRWSPAEQIQKKINMMMDAHELTWDVFRTYMLCGGLNYTDPRTGQSAEVKAGIPAHNLFAYNVTSGYKGRPEHALFRTYVDSNVEDPSAAPTGIPFTHPDADIIFTIKWFVRWFEDTNKVKVTAMYMRPELRDVISLNNQLRLAMGGWIPKIGAVAGDSTVTVAPTIIPSNGVLPPNSLAVDANGNLASIAGVPIRICDIAYPDPRDGVYKRIFPMNKIVFVAEQNQQGSKEAPGKTQYCISEESGGKPGMWMRTQTETMIPNAPGMAFQLGNAGLPYLKYGSRVAHMTVCSVEDIQKRLVILPDLGHGIWL